MYSHSLLFYTRGISHTHKEDIIISTTSSEHSTVHFISRAIQQKPNQTPEFIQTVEESCRTMEISDGGKMKRRLYRYDFGPQVVHTPTVEELDQSGPE